jgi:hypothetical protein
MNVKMRRREEIYPAKYPQKATQIVGKKKVLCERKKP